MNTNLLLKLPEGNSEIASKIKAVRCKFHCTFAEALYSIQHGEVFFQIYSPDKGEEPEGEETDA